MGRLWKRKMAFRRFLKEGLDFEDRNLERKLYRFKFWKN